MMQNNLIETQNDHKEMQKTTPNTPNQTVIKCWLTVVSVPSDCSGKDDYFSFVPPGLGFEPAIHRPDGNQQNRCGFKYN